VTTWLLDTNLISELRRPKPEPKLRRALDAPDGFAPWAGLDSANPEIDPPNEINYGCTAPASAFVGPGIA
jgi:hypothetical protein